MKMEKKIIIVDKDDNVLKKESKEKAHLKDGIMHRAITIFIFNDKNQLLITKRSKFKKLWPLVWESSCSTHPYEDETYIQSGERRLPQELNLSCQLKPLLKFIYKSNYKNKGSENELCSLLLGKYDGTIKPSWKEVANFKWISLENLKKEIKKSPEKYAPWLKIALEKYNLNNGDILRDKLIMLGDKRVKVKNKTNFKPEYYKILTRVGKNVDEVIDSFYNKDIFIKYPEKKEIYKDMLNRKKGTQKLRAMSAYLAFWAFAGKEINSKEVKELITAVELENYSNYELNWLFDKKGSVKEGPTYNLELKKAGLATHGFIQDALFLVSKFGPEYVKVFLEINDRTHRGWTPELFDLNYNNKKLLNDFEYFWSKYKIRNVEAGGQFYDNYVKLAYIYNGKKNKDLYLSLKQIFEEFGEGVQILNDLGDFAPPGEIILHEKKESDQLCDLREGLITLPIWLIYNRASEKEKKFLMSIQGKRKLPQKDYIQVIKILHKSDTFSDIFNLLKRKALFLQKMIDTLNIESDAKALLKVMVTLLYCNKLMHRLKDIYNNLNKREK